MLGSRCIRKRLMRGAVSCVLCIFLFLAIDRATATIELMPESSTDTDSQTVKEVMAVFRVADEAVHQRNIKPVMALYSDHYNYHGIKKADVRKIWTDLFDEFQDVTDVHRFSRITKVGSGAKTVVEVTCTGSLSGVSKTSGLRVPIDSVRNSTTSCSKTTPGKYTGMWAIHRG